MGAGSALSTGMSEPQNLTDLIEQLTDLKTTCSVCLSASISLLAPVVVTSWVSQEKKDTPSRITNGFLVSVILMSATVLLGCIVDYRIPNPDNEKLAIFTHITLMSKGWCKTQAVACVFRLLTFLPARVEMAQFDPGS